MNDSTVKTFVKAIKTKKKDPSPYDTTAKVTRVEGNTVWVHISGGVDETPVRRTVNAKVGDEVQVRVGGGKAWITGNASSPPTDDTRAIKADTNATIAKNIADSAFSSAETAADAAGRAITSATQAANAAASAQTSANNAQISANNAQTSANNANQQAQYATNYANNALIQLGTVESVVDTLTWISEHSVFVPTTDTTVQTNKLYYVPANNILPMTSGTTELNGITYVVDAVAGTVTANGTATSLSLFGIGIPDATAGEQIWFSGVSGGGATTYGLRYSNGPQSVSIYDGIGTATIKSSGNLYLNIYVASGVTVNNIVFTPRVATENDGFKYQIVENPTGDPASQGWFELSIDDAVKTYVQAHLALTDDGLYVLNDSSAYKMLIANDGTYIQAPNGQTVNQSTADGNVIRATNGDVIAHLGYGEGASQSGTATAPYYTLGTRATTSSAYNSSSTYSVGDICVYNGTIYVCVSAITTPESWNSEHWKLSIGNYSIAEGQNGVSAGIRTHAEGLNTKAINDSSHSEGWYTLASGGYSHAEGRETTASDNASHAEGYRTTAEGYASHAEGRETTASNQNAHAEGQNTIASGIDSHAQNLQTIAQGYAQTVIGKYNIAQGTASSSASTDYACIVGNGTSDSARSNALTVDWSGNVNIASGAKYKINGTNLSASDVGVTDYITSKGTNGNWYYEKYASGKIEAVFHGSVAYGTMSASGQLYRSTNNAVAIPGGIFTATPQRTEITLNNSATVVVCATAVASSSTNVNVQVWRSTNSASSIDATIRCTYTP